MCVRKKVPPRYTAQSCDFSTGKPEERDLTPCGGPEVPRLYNLYIYIYKGISESLGYRLLLGLLIISRTENYTHGTGKRRGKTRENKKKKMK